MKTRVCVVVVLFCSMPVIRAQQTSRPVVEIKATATTEAPTSHSAVTMSALCDETGNVYIRPSDEDDPLGQLHAPIVEIASDGTSRTATLSADGVGKTYFIRDGIVYALESIPHSSFYITGTAKDGSVKSRTKLVLDPFVDRQHFVAVSHLAVFKSGQYLVVGLAGEIRQTAPHLRTPFTAVFDSSGHLVKRIYEPEDEDAHQHAEGSDPKYLICCSDSGNEFVGYNADVAAGTDGNVYLLHGTSPPLIYVISPAGDVLRKLQVEAAKPELTANSIRFYGGRLAIGFDWLGDVPKSLIKVVDLKGNPVADYEVSEGSGDSDPILACYNSEGFTLVPRWVGTKPYVLKAKLP